MKLRRCVKCRKDKPLSDFEKVKSGKSYKATCEQCLQMYRYSWERRHTKAVDTRDIKHELEEVFRKWRATAFSETLPASTSVSESLIEASS